MTATWTGALVCGALGCWIPWLIRRLPEPDARAALNYTGPSMRQVGAGRWLPVVTCMISATVGAVLGARLGWVPDLAWLGVVVPVGVGLGLIDWRARLLPRAIVAGLYALVILGMVATALVHGATHDLVRAGLGWLVYGGWYFVLWRFAGAVGYGDVRLAGLLGLILGHLGWPALVTGWLAGPLIGLLLIPLHRRASPPSAWWRHKVPFGPAMLLGALVGIVLGGGIPG